MKTMAKVFMAAAVIAVFGFSMPARACFAPPAHMTGHHSELVRDSSDIVLARMIRSIESRSERYLNLEIPIFETLEVLRGYAPEVFEFGHGYAAPSKEQLEKLNLAAELTRDFNGHRQGVFWDKKITRQWNWSDCRMHPVFVTGETYLLFLDRPHWRSYEIVRSNDDYWLTAVRNLIADPSRRSGLSLSVQEWLSLSRGVFIGRIQSCAGPEFDVIESLHGNFDQSWVYSDEVDASYWPLGKCKIGKEYLVIAYRDEPEVLPYYSSTIVDIDGETVDFSEAISDSEIEILDEPVITLDELRAYFLNR